MAVLFYDFCYYSTEKTLFTWSRLVQRQERLNLSVNFSSDMDKMNADCRASRAVFCCLGVILWSASSLQQTLGSSVNEFSIQSALSQRRSAQCRIRFKDLSLPSHCLLLLGLSEWAMRTTLSLCSRDRSSPGTDINQESGRRLLFRYIKTYKAPPVSFFVIPAQRRTG